jgi:ATP-dependent protease ClpP protease subunit
MKDQKMIFRFLSCILFPMMCMTHQLVGAMDFQVSKFDFSKFTGLTPNGYDEKCFNEIRAIGDISQDDSEKFKKSYLELKRKNSSSECKYLKNYNISIALNSKGGSIYEAMRLGRVIRENEFVTKVYKNEVCASACVLMFGAGTNKISFGKIQIHRPYFSELDSNLSYRQIQNMRYKIIEDMKNYANEMDFSSILIDEMIAISPENMRTLTSSEMEKYRMLGDDPTIDEKNVAKNAAFYGITSAEYRRKNAEADLRCLNSGDMYSECYQSVMLNIPISEVSKRINRIVSKCPKNTTGQNSCQKDILVYGK